MFNKLRRLFTRRRIAEPRVEVIDLTTWNGRGDQVLTPINRPDALEAVPHSLPAVDPDQADLRLLVAQLIAELHGRHGVDAGHPDVLDNWLDSQVPLWQHLVDQEARSRGSTLERLIAVDEENLQREAQELLSLQREVRRLEESYQHWRDVLAGRAEAEAPRTPSRAESAAALPFLELAEYHPGSRPATAPRSMEPSKPESPTGPRSVDPIDEEDSDVA